MPKPSGDDTYVSEYAVAVALESTYPKSFVVLEDT